MRIRNGVYWYKEQGIFDANTYVLQLQDELTILIDPGLENYLEPRLKEMQGDGISPKDIDVIAITHLHPDHCGATAALKEVSGAEVALHPLQVDYLDIMAEESKKFLGVDIAYKFNADIVLEERLSLGKTELEVLHTPGHSPCSICFYAEDKKMLICGDLVFEQGVGRTDLPFGNTDELKSSIETVSALDTELLLPGHGTIIEGRNNIERNYDFVKAAYFKNFF
ncbi:MBL fold metallo-hydrolase [ANME-1 cluster archaeon GoMg4]|nr:MBL fold metallo-hydrolase [ANME-1 cluster archaeon GoMg4]